MHEVIGELERLRRRSRRLLVAQRAAVVLAWVMAVGLALVLLDFALRLPGTVRLLSLGLGVAALGWAGQTYLLPALRFHPSLTQLALRVERWMPALAGRLASSVEFAMSGEMSANSLAARCVRETQRRLAGEALRGTLDVRRTRRGLSVFLLLLVVAVVLTATFPASARIGVSRLLLPLGSTMWPARTGVVSMMNDIVGASSVFPRGRALPLRAQVTKGEDDQRIVARYRLKEDGTYGAWRTILLTHQADGLHERLIDSDAEAAQVVFLTEDARTEQESIQLVHPPEVSSARLVVTPPEYARHVQDALEVDLGPGTDERSIAPRSSLIGSRVELDLRLNKSLPVPPTEGDAVSEQWIRETFGWSTLTPAPTLDVHSQQGRWMLGWRLTGRTDLSLNLVDEFGLGNDEPITFRIDATEDAAPNVTITDPQYDDVALRTARVELAANARDDVAVRRLGLEAVHASTDVPEEPAPAADDQAPVVLWSEAREVDAAAATIRSELDLQEYDLNPGDEIIIHAVANDAFELDGLEHPPVRSVPRRLRIVTEIELAEQLRRQLGAVRQNAIRVEVTQSQLRQDVMDEGVQPGAERAQAQVGQRIGDQAGVIEELTEQLDRNRFEDAQFGELLRRSQDLLQAAGQAANRAAQAIDQVQREDASSEDAGATSEGATEEVVDAQRDVADELMSLIDLLDRDEDTWVVTRQLENLLNEQRRLEQDTRELSTRTLGQTREQMDKALLRELDRIENRQREVLDETESLTDDMRDRAEAMEESDPQSAESIRSAAEMADRRDVTADMEDAAQRAHENQLQQSAESQRSAAETLASMLEAIEDTERAQAEDLLRRLADLLESIRRLVKVQGDELETLRGAMLEQTFGQRDDAMIRLARNTASVANAAREAGVETRRIGGVLDRAAEAQRQAVTLLRERPVNGDDAIDAETRSLELLNKALEMAEALEQQVQDDLVRQIREDLMDAYREIAKRQLEVREQTLPLAGIGLLDRRDLVRARRLLAGQEQIREDLDTVRAQTVEIADSIVFTHVHEAMNNWSRAVSDELSMDEVTINTPDRQLLIADSLDRLIEALEESLEPPEEFAENAQPDDGGGGGGTSGPQPLIPPISELRLLRGMQEQVYDRTRMLDGRDDLVARSRQERLQNIGLHQRELMTLGQQFIEKMRSEQTPPTPPADESAEPKVDEDRLHAPVQRATETGV